MYSLILSSKLPNAKQFKRWVTGEVLPSIRKTGHYEIKKRYQPTRPLTTDDYIDAGKTIAKCDNRRLPLVLDMFRKAGLDVEKITEQESESPEDDTCKVALVELLNRYSMEELCERLPICRTAIYYYRVGKYNPRKERREEIIRILEG